MADSAPKPAAPGAKQPRDQSTIQFPYGDLKDAIDVAAGMMKLGAVPADPDQLAAALGQSPASGNFRLKVGTAKIFGVIETQQGKYRLTDLGFAITDKSRATAAKADAFLTVALYRKLYDEFRNRQLPPRPAALENTFANFGVAPKQKERARQAFDRSAKQAGFFELGNDRLIRPAGSTLNPADESLPDIDAAAEAGDANNCGSGIRLGGGGNGRPPRGLHPFIEGLLQTLPEPGTLWAIEGRAAWLQAAAQNFMLIYKGDGRIEVQVSAKNAT